MKRCGMIGEMRNSTNSSMISPGQVADLRQTKTLLPKDRPARVGSKPKIHLAWYVALNTKKSERKMSNIPQIKWKCPPKFSLNTGWYIAAGEGSQDAVAQKCREMCVLEIPPSPFTWHLMEGDLHDNSQTPIIPIIPIEEVSSINLQPPASCPLTSGNLPFSPCDPSGSEDGSMYVEPHAESPVDMLHGLGSSDLEIVATVAARILGKEDIDAELLIKCLTDPEMIKKLINGNGSTSKPEDEAPLALKADTCLPLPSLTPMVVLPCSKAKTETNKLASKLVSMCAGSAETCKSKGTKRLNPSPRLDSDRPTKKLTGECGGPTSRIDQAARQQQARPLVPCTLRPDEETTKRPFKKCVFPDVTGAKPNPSSSKPNMEAARRMIHDYGGPDVAQIKPMTPLVLSTSISSNIDRAVEKYLLPDHGWRRSFVGPSSSLFASTASAPVTNVHVWPNSPESHFNATGTFRPSFTPRAALVGQVDLQYHNSVIKQHQKIHDIGEDKFPKICLSSNHLQVVGLAHKVTTTDMNQKYKPCLYFGRSTGCRNGYNCPYRHDLSK